MTKQTLITNVGTVGHIDHGEFKPIPTARIMKLTNEEAVNLLEYISCGEPYQVESDDFEFMGEDADGRDGVYTESIINIASQSTVYIKNLQTENEKLKQQIIDDELIFANAVRSYVKEVAELKQTLSDLQITLDEQVAYGEALRDAIFPLAFQAKQHEVEGSPRYSVFRDAIHEADSIQHSSPSPELLNTIKGDAVKGYANNLPFKDDLLTRKEVERHLGKYIASGGKL